MRNIYTVKRTVYEEESCLKQDRGKTSKVKNVLNLMKISKRTQRVLLGMAAFGLITVGVLLFRGNIVALHKDHSDLIQQGGEYLALNPNLSIKQKIIFLGGTAIFALILTKVPRARIIFKKIRKLLGAWKKKPEAPTVVTATPPTNKPPVSQKPRVAPRRGWH